MSAVVEIVGVQLAEDLEDLIIHDQETCTETEDNNTQGGCDDTNSNSIDNHHGECSICLQKILLQDMALVKGCEHAYCVTCILRWASYKKKLTCPQCKNPFEYLNVHRALDGSISDYMFEESICLLLKASWFNPHFLREHHDISDEVDDYCYEDDEEDIDEIYFGGPSNLHVGNKRRGDSGYVRAGRQKARPTGSPCTHYSGAGQSNQQPTKEITIPPKEIVGRRAKRALKRDAADRAAAAKHQ